MVVLGHIVVVVAAGGQASAGTCLAFFNLHVFLFLLPFVVLPLPLRLLFLLLAACPKPACHVANQLSRQSARGDACGRFGQAKILEQTCLNPQQGEGGRKKQTSKQHGKRRKKKQ